MTEERSPFSEWFAADEQRRKDRAEGTPRVGGYLGFDYVSAYLKAARVLVEATADDRPGMAVPCAYLQRHALELACKFVTRMAYMVAAEGKSVTATESVNAFTIIEAEQTPTGHDLAALATTMSEALAEVGFESPAIMLSLVDELARFEDGDPTRLRYPSGTPKGGYAGGSFPEPAILPIVNWQKRLDEIEREVLAMNPFREHGTRSSLCEQLWVESQEQRRQMHELCPDPSASAHSTDFCAGCVARGYDPLLDARPTTAHCAPHGNHAHVLCVDDAVVDVVAGLRQEYTPVLEDGSHAINGA